MFFEWIALQDILILNFNLTLPATIVLGAYVTLTLFLLARHYRQVINYDVKQWLLLAGLLLLAPLAARAS